MNQFQILAISAILISNIVAMLGAGAVSLQSEKRSFLYLVVSSLSIIVTIIISGLATWVVNDCILKPLNVEDLRVFIGMLFAISLSFASRAVIRLAFKEQYYVYEKSYGLPIQTAVTLATILVVNYSQTFLLTMFELSMFCVGFLIVQIVMYPLYDKIDNTKVLKPARNIPLSLIVLSIISMIIYAVSMFF